MNQFNVWLVSLFYLQALIRHDVQQIYRFSIAKESPFFTSFYLGNEFPHVVSDPLPQYDFYDASGHPS